MSTHRLAPAFLAWLAVAGCGIVLDTAPSDGGGESTLDASTRPVVDDGPAEPDDAAGPAPDGAVTNADDARDANDANDADSSSILDAEVPDAYVPPVVVSMTLLPMADRVRGLDGTILPDGLKDGVFEVVVRGPVVAFALLRTNAGGTPIGAQQWDTYVGDDVLPAGLAPAFATGFQTVQLGVFDGEALQNDAAGRCFLDSASERTLQIYGVDAGSFTSGNSFRLWAQAPTRELIAGPVLTLP